MWEAMRLCLLLSPLVPRCLVSTRVGKIDSSPFFMPAVLPPSLLQKASQYLGMEPLTDPDYDTMIIPLPWEADNNAKPLVQCPQEKATQAGASDEDTNLHEAASIYCKAGLGSLVEFYVDPRFQANYDRLVGSDGWIAKGYVSYMGLRKDQDKTSAEEDILVQSLRHFSQYPIVLTNFGGGRVPKHMTPERFPQLVLMHARASATDFKKGFNHNKLITMLFTKVKGGLALDADQWVNAGADVMVDKAFEQTTKEYPYPVMPVHWISRDPEASDMKEYSDGYSFHFKGEGSPDRSMRWGHAHPTWTHCALPWLARWTSYVLAPEKTEAPAWLTAQGFVSDEPLLNFALWAEGKTKQWCKFDLPGVSDFNTFISQEEKKEIYADSKYYPKGIAYLFFTAHGAKEPEQSVAMLTEIWEPEDDKRQAILYDGKWFGSGKQLKEYDPELACIA